jgi:hypothetical protein
MGATGARLRRADMQLLLRRVQSLRPMQSMRQRKHRSGARGPRVQVSGRGKLTVAGDLNIIEHQVIGAEVTGPPTSWRTATIAAILARCGEDLDDPAFFRAHIKCAYGVESLAELSDDALNQTRQYVFSQPRR